MSEFENLAKFINGSKERIFNDRFVILLSIEIRLKSTEINGDLILPRYYLGDVFYNGENITRSSMIKDLMSKKSLEEANLLLKKALDFNFENKTQIKEWIALQTGISDCSLSVIV